MRNRTAVGAEVMFGDPNTVKSKSLQRLYLLKYPLVKLADWPVKFRHMSRQEVRAEFHAASTILLNFVDEGREIGPTIVSKPQPVNASANQLLCRYWDRNLEICTLPDTSCGIEGVSSRVTRTNSRAVCANGSGSLAPCPSMPTLS